MGFQKIKNFLNTTPDDKDLPRFATKKWIEVYDQSRDNYSVSKEIRIKTSMLKSGLWGFSDAYIVVEGTSTLDGDNDANKRNKILHLKTKHHLLTTFQKLMAYKLIMQKT